MKAYPNVGLEYLLYEMSYANIVMYSSILPSYDDYKGSKKKGTIFSSDSSRSGGFGGFIKSMKGLKNGRT